MTVGLRYSRRAKVDHCSPPACLTVFRSRKGGVWIWTVGQTRWVSRKAKCNPAIGVPSTDIEGWEATMFDQDGEVWTAKAKTAASYAATMRRPSHPAKGTTSLLTWGLTNCGSWR